MQSKCIWKNTINLSTREVRKCGLRQQRQFQQTLLQGNKLSWESTVLPVSPLQAAKYDVVTWNSLDGVGVQVPRDVEAVAALHGSDSGLHDSGRTQHRHPGVCRRKVAVPLQPRLKARTEKNKTNLDQVISTLSHIRHTLNLQFSTLLLPLSQLWHVAIMHLFLCFSLIRSFTGLIYARRRSAHVRIPERGEDAPASLFKKKMSFGVK